MDLKNLINDDEKGGSKAGQSTTPTAPSQPHASAQPSTPSHYAHPSQQQTPLYAPPSAGGIAGHAPQGPGVTPLRTSPQNAANAQYPFPQHTQQSPISAAPGQQYRPFESQPAAAAGRPSSHGHPYQTGQPTQATYGGQQPPLQPQSSFTNFSPTPPSHLSRTPSSMRQSPITTLSSLPSQQQQPHQFSQSNTPLGPPTHLPQRAPTFPEVQSPLRQRSYSNASNGLASGSPAQHYPGIPNIVESPGAYARPSPQSAHSRRQSEYLSHKGSRERSISVSPKTQPPPRIPSLGSQQSSLSNTQEIYSARTSEQYNSAPLAGSPNHVTQLSAHPQSQLPPRFAAYPNAASEVPQSTPTSLQSAAGGSAPSAQSSLSSQTSANQAPPPQQPILQHQSEKMGMNHLMTPASEVPPKVNGDTKTSQLAAPVAKQRDGPSIFMEKKKRTPTPESREPLAPPPATNSQPPDAHSEKANSIHADVNMTDAQPNGAVPAASTDSGAKASLKRPASSSNPHEEPPSKQAKPSPSKRKYTERPIWARLSRFNPKYQHHGHTNGARNGRPPPRVNGGGPVKAAAKMAQQRHSDQAELLDTDMMRIRSFLGDWERSYTNSQPLPDTKRVIADWLFRELYALKDVGTDPHYGAVEIEGKVGTLFHKDSGDRCSLPVISTTVIHPAKADELRFESRMQEAEHAHMNRTLNKSCQESHAPGRVNMTYKHFTDIDSFQPLSPTGLAALPDSARNRLGQHRHAPKLRTTLRHEKNKQPYIAARIVKVNVANLHIFSPQDPYDLRISINVEVNLDRPDLPAESLVSTKDDDDPQPDRKKDRVSYSHLAYQIDLTRVDAVQQRPKYELEIEVDANLLREQMGVSERGEESAFGDVVAGFWDNAVTLMRERMK